MEFVNSFNKVQSGYGVGEWAGYSYNCGVGCSHDCRYCYSRSFFVEKRLVANDADWVVERPKPYKININQKADGRVMFPSTHDISPAYLVTYCKTLRNILTSGNDVLLVSKPHFECIETICAEFRDFRGQMEFRFSIGSLNPEVTSFWEPNAPRPEERVRCLVHAAEQGYQTSVSMEPILEGKDDAIETFTALKALTTGTIWVGMMNDLGKRVDVSVPEISQAVDRIKQLQARSEMLELHRLLNHEPQVRWKESISNLVRWAAI